MFAKALCKYRGCNAKKKGNVKKRNKFTYYSIEHTATAKTAKNHRRHFYFCGVICLT